MAEVRLKHRVRHLWIDLDGTLLAQRKGALYWRFLRTSLQYLYRNARVNPIRGLRVITAVRKALEQAGTGELNDARATRALARELSIPEGTARAMVRALMIQAFANARDCFYPVPGAREFVEWASRYFTLSVATNPLWPREAALMRLEWAGIDSARFQFIAHAGEMSTCKPHVEYYREFGRICASGEDNALMIGDNPRKDGPAADIGVPVFLLDFRTGAPKAIAPADHNGVPVWRGNFQDLQSLLELNLKEWETRL